MLNWNDQKCNFDGHLCPEEQDVNAGSAEDTGHRFRKRDVCVGHVGETSGIDCRFGKSENSNTGSVFGER